MTTERTQALYTAAAIGCGLLFILGAFVSANGMATKGMLFAVIVALAFCGTYVIVLDRRGANAARRNAELTRANAEISRREANLRIQMRYTLRDPIAAIVGEADRLISSPEMENDERVSVLAMIRANAREVEHTLDQLARTPIGRAVTTPPISSVVLMDQELESIAASSPSAANFDLDIAETRAWGDPSKVRQILRTLVNISTLDEGAQLTLQTAQRGASATATVSGKGAILPTATHAALSEDVHHTDSADGVRAAMATAIALAESMDGTISFVTAFGVSHVVLTLPSPPNWALRRPVASTRSNHGDPTADGRRPTPESLASTSARRTASRQNT
ncbi:MAG: hypothetical protein DWP92_02695 [Armatimonadetes bacterium]|nr:MAG: hypothetical protein DWP92_02695 [Armatimonadota bacterium]